MDWQYNYLVTAFPNDKVDVSRLQKEIQLVISDLSYINLDNVSCSIFFTREISDPEETSLGLIIGNHSGDALQIISGLCELIDKVGDQNLNNINPKGISWGQEDNLDLDFFQHIINDSKIIVNLSGYYDISYSINSAHQTNARSITGIQIKVNDTNFISKTLSASYSRNKSNNDNHNILPSCSILLNADDYIEICGFRLGDNTLTLTKKASSFVRIKYIGN